MTHNALVLEQQLLELKQRLDQLQRKKLPDLQQQLDALSAVVSDALTDVLVLNRVLTKGDDDGPAQDLHIPAPF